MSSYLTRREIENIRSNLEKAIQKSIGNIDVHQVRNIIENCLYNGSDKKRTIEKLNELLDSKRAGRLYDKIQDLLEELNSHSNSKAKKRTSDNIEPNGNGNNSNNYDNEEKNVKKQKITTSSFVDTKSLENINKMSTNTESEYKSENPTLVAAMTELQFLPSNSSTDANTNNSLTTQQIKAMMANAQREIEERKRALTLLKTKDSILSTTNAATSSGGTSSALPAAQLAAQKIKLPINPEDAERVKKIAELQAQIRAKLSGTLSAIIQPAIQDKPKPLILDEEGRTVDKSGRAISIPTLAPTLKANIRAKKKEIFNKNVQQMEKPYEEEGLTFFDDRINAKSAIRTKRILRFHEPGKFQQMAERMRMKAQLEKLQNEISQIARKTGISSATKLALIAPKQDSHSDDVPQMEWWDSVILVNDLNTLNDNNKIAIRESAITNLIEHPTQIKPPNELLKPVYLPVFLTRKERKKLRRQNRREAWKEEQEKIRIGLAPPPEPKLRISNLMRVLGTEAIQDPTKIEQHVREQMAKRQKAHEDANNARKLTVEQKRDKKIRKVREDTSGGVHVSVYRIRELQENQSKKYKVETNAKQLLMTGIVVLFRDCCVVVVEGGPKQQKRYKRLMLHRIKWEEDMAKNADGNEISNSCVLVWEGTSQRRHFGEIKFKIFPMEKMAREFFQKHQVEHYWDLAYSGAVLEASEDV